MGTTIAAEALGAGVLTALLCVCLKATLVPVWGPSVKESGRRTPCVTLALLALGVVQFFGTVGLAEADGQYAAFAEVLWPFQLWFYGERGDCQSSVGLSTAVSLRTVVFVLLGLPALYFVRLLLASSIEGWWLARREKERVAPSAAAAPAAASKRQPKEARARMRELWGMTGCALLHFPNVEIAFLLAAYSGTTTALASLLSRGCSTLAVLVGAVIFALYPCLLLLHAWQFFLSRIWADRSLLLFVPAGEPAWDSAENGGASTSEEEEAGAYGFERNDAAASKLAGGGNGQLLTPRRPPRSFWEGVRDGLAGRSDSAFEPFDRGMWRTRDCGGHVAERRAFRLGLAPLFQDFHRSGAVYLVISLAAQMASALTVASLGPRRALTSLLCIAAADALILFWLRPYINTVVNTAQTGATLLKAVTLALLLVAERIGNGAYLAPLAVFSSVAAVILLLVPCYVDFIASVRWVIVQARTQVVLPTAFEAASGASAEKMPAASFRPNWSEFVACTAVALRQNVFMTARVLQRSVKPPWRRNDPLTLLPTGGLANGSFGRYYGGVAGSERILLAEEDRFFPIAFTSRLAATGTPAGPAADSGSVNGSSDLTIDVPSDWNRAPVQVVVEGGSSDEGCLDGGVRSGSLSGGSGGGSGGSGGSSEAPSVGAAASRTSASGSSGEAVLSSLNVAAAAAAAVAAAPAGGSEGRDNDAALPDISLPRPAVAAARSGSDYSSQRPSGSLQRGSSKGTEATAETESLRSRETDEADSREAAVDGTPPQQRRDEGGTSLGAALVSAGSLALEASTGSLDTSDNDESDEAALLGATASATGGGGGGGGRIEAPHTTFDDFSDDSDLSSRPGSVRGAQLLGIDGIRALRASSASSLLSLDESESALAPFVAQADDKSSQLRRPSWLGGRIAVDDVPRRSPVPRPSKGASSGEKGTKSIFALRRPSLGSGGGGGAASSSSAAAAGAGEGQSLWRGASSGNRRGGVEEDGAPRQRTRSLIESRAASLYAEDVGGAETQGPWR